MLSFETLVVAACSLRVAADDEAAYLEVITALGAYVAPSEGQVKFLEETLEAFGLTSLE